MTSQVILARGCPQVVSQVSWIPSPERKSYGLVRVPKPICWLGGVPMIDKAESNPAVAKDDEDDNSEGELESLIILSLFVTGSDVKLETPIFSNLAGAKKIFKNIN